ncbi:MAG: glycoside hydrolase family 2, partial [Armatimonadetes bacterium]|nr:glycoside hydrolase family 2 [Armatimonadota bacterium]
DLNDPYLYRVSARLTDDAGVALDETSARCGFRDFRFQNGAFRLNGRRLLLKCSHTGNHCPVGLQLPPDPDMLRKDLLNVKVMGFNAIRFIAGLATRQQLDLCDELGLLVYEEHYGSWCLADSPHMAERYDRSLTEMLRRDRNHPSVAIWGLLNETSDGPVFRHAVACLPLVRTLDDTRLVFLNSGRFDSQVGSSLTGLSLWRTDAGPDPNVTHNGTDRALTGLGITWQPGQLALHPGSKGEYSVVRWTAPAAGEVAVSAVFTSIAEHATTDVHVLHQGKAAFDGFVNVEGQGGRAAFEGKLTVRAGDTVDCAVGWGNANYGGDTTALALTLQAAEGRFNAAESFGLGAQPNGPWSYGVLSPGAKPDSATFTPYPVGTTIGDETGIGSLSNPGSGVWEDLLDDQHPYQRVPHTASVIHFLRSVSSARKPVFISEYGVGSAVDLCRVTRWYEQLGKTEVEDARFYSDKLDRFLADWGRWKMEECFARPEEFFLASQRSMAADRLYGLNAIRANPSVVAHSLTGTVDQGMSGEGLFTTFRELKPGTTDALLEAWAPLRLGLFAEPVQVYRGGTVRLEAVLANEDALAPGDYPVRIVVAGPGTTRLMDRAVTLTVPAPKEGREPPFALPFLAEDLAVDGPAGEYRFLATFERGGAATGGEARFFVADAAAMPPVETEVALWGEDPGLAQWLGQHGIRTHPLSAATAGREVILVGRQGGPDAAAWSGLAERIARGSTAVFLSPEAFRRGEDPVDGLPLAHRGSLVALMGWLYHKDEWAKAHPIFDGLPAGGLMDHLYYRELIPDLVFSGQDPPAEAVAGACNASFDYSSGLLTAVYPLGAGRVILNTLLIRENLGPNPVAERLLRNLLRYAARDAGRPPAELARR